MMPPVTPSRSHWRCCFYSKTDDCMNPEICSHSLATISYSLLIIYLTCSASYNCVRRSSQREIIRRARNYKWIKFNKGNHRRGVLIILATSPPPRVASHTCNYLILYGCVETLSAVVVLIQLRRSGFHLLSVSKRNIFADL